MVTHPSAVTVRPSLSHPPPLLLLPSILIPSPPPLSTPSLIILIDPTPSSLSSSPSTLPMGAGASRPPIPATHPAGVAFRRKLEEIRRRRKVRAFRDSIVSTTELLKDRADLESVGDVARLSAVGFETDSAEQAKDDKPSGEKKEEADVARTEVIASEPAGNVAAEEVKAETKEAGEIGEKKKVAEVVVTKKVEIADAVTSLAAEVALLKIEEDGEEEEEEEEDKDGSELTADLPGSPSFRYFVMINNKAGDSDDSDNNQEAAGGHGKDDEEEEGT